MDQPGLSVIITALNEEGNVEAVVHGTLKGFEDYRIDGEVVLIDDGSSDATTRLSHELAAKDSRVHVLRHEVPHGVGASFWDGVEAARGECVCWLPGDNEVDPAELLRYYPLLEHVDIVASYQFDKKVRSVFRIALSAVFQFIVKTTFRLSLTYTNGTSLYRRSVLQSLNCRNKGFFFLTEILVRADRQDYLFADVPIRLSARLAGKSKATTFKALRKVMGGYLRLVWDIYFRRQGRAARGVIPESRTAWRYASGKPSGPKGS